MKFLKYFTIANHEITWKEFIRTFSTLFYALLKFLVVNRVNVFALLGCAKLLTFFYQPKVKSRSIISVFFAKMSILIGIILELISTASSSTVIKA